MRTLRIADGPDEVHRMVIARMRAAIPATFPSHHPHNPEDYHSEVNRKALSVDYDDYRMTNIPARL